MWHKFPSSGGKLAESGTALVSAFGMCPLSSQNKAAEALQGCGVAHEVALQTRHAMRDGVGQFHGRIRIAYSRAKFSAAKIPGTSAARVTQAAMVGG